VYEGAKAALLPCSTRVSNGVSPSAQTVWTDVRLQPVLGLLPGAADTTASVALQFTTNGLLAVGSASGWDVCSNDVRGAVAAAVSGGAWSRLTVLNDYGAGKAAIFLNGQLLRQLTPLMGGASSFSCAAWSAGGGEMRLDNVLVTNAVPPGLSDGAEVAQYGYVALTRTVGAGQQYASLGAALAAAHARDTIIVVPGSTLTEGALATVSNLIVIVSNSTVACAGVTVGSNSVIRVVDGTITVNGTDYSGTFVIDRSLPAGIMPSPLPFSDGFESYPDTSLLAWMGASGWAASNASDAVVQSATVHAGARAVRVANTATVSQSITNSAGVRRVWTQTWLRPALGDRGAWLTNNTASVRLCFETNGYVSLYSNGWVVCSNDFWGGSVPGITPGRWVQLAVFQDYSNRESAVFLDGRLLRQKVPFANSNSRFSQFATSSTLGSSFVDDVSIASSVPTDLLGYDGDGDGVADALELQQYGTVLWWPGTVVRFR